MALVFLLTAVWLPVKASAPIIVRPPIPTDVKGMITYYANEYEVSAYQMEKTLFCESSLNPNAKNITPREQSYGVAQINLLAHKNITIAQATDPQFAIEWTAKAFSQGKQGMWTCYRTLFK